MGSFLVTFACFDVNDIMIFKVPQFSGKSKAFYVDDRLFIYLYYVYKEASIFLHNYYPVKR